MLWTDRRDLITEDYLGTIDGFAKSICVDNDMKLIDKIILGSEEAGMDLNGKIESFSAEVYGGGLVSANHMAAVMNTGTRAAITQRVLPMQVVVDGPGSPIKRWVAGFVLYVIYRDAFNRNGQDRLKDKMKTYFDEKQRFFNGKISSYGLPVAMNPLSQPAAELERDTGTWGNDNVSLVAGSGTITDQYNFAVTFVDMSSSQLYVSQTEKNNAESMPSRTIKLDMEAAKVAKIDITSLNPPTGVQHQSTWQVCRIAPLKATHWNVYAGPSGSDLRLQNATPIPIATKTYTFSADPSLTGYVVGTGQFEDRRITMTRVRRRS